MKKFWSRIMTRFKTYRTGWIEFLLTTFNAVWFSFPIMERLSCKLGFASSANEAIVMPFLVHSRNNGSLNILIAFCTLFNHFVDQKCGLIRDSKTVELLISVLVFSIYAQTATNEIA